MVKRTKEQALSFFSMQTEKSENDAYFTKDNDAKFCVDYAIQNSPQDTKWIEPFAGNGAFLKFLPKNTPAYDINPLGKNIKKENSFKINWEGRSALTNIPFKLKKECVKKALQEAEFFWTIGPPGLLSLKNCWVDKVILFEYGNWTMPRSYLEFDLPDGRKKIIYCAFFKIMRENFRKEIIPSSEIWRVGPTNELQIDNRFIIRQRDGTLRKCNLKEDIK